MASKNKIQTAPSPPKIHMLASSKSVEKKKPKLTKIIHIGVTAILFLPHCEKHLVVCVIITHKFS